MPDNSFELKVLLFAALKERMGQDHIQIRVDEGSNAALLLERLFLQFPELEAFSRSVILSINQKFANPEQLVHPGDEVALFPPVSGG